MVSVLIAGYPMRVISYSNNRIVAQLPEVINLSGEGNPQPADIVINKNGVPYFSPFLFHVLRPQNN
jgi:hypothetical protein